MYVVSDICRKQIKEVKTYTSQGNLLQNDIKLQLVY